MSEEKKSRRVDARRDLRAPSRSLASSSSHGDPTDAPCTPPLGDFPFDNQGAGYDAEMHHRLISACVERERRRLSRVWTTRRDVKAIITNDVMGFAVALFLGFVAPATAWLAFQFAVDVRAEELTPPPPLALWGYLCDRSIGFTITGVSVVLQLVAAFGFCRWLRLRREEVARGVAHDLEHLLNEGALTGWIVRLQSALKILSLGDAPDVEHRQSAVAAYHAQWYWRLIDRLAVSFSFDWRHYKQEKAQTRSISATWRILLAVVFVIFVVAAVRNWIVSNDFDVGDFADLALFATLNWSASVVVLALLGRCIAQSRRQTTETIEHALYGGRWIDPHESHGSTGDPLTPRERALSKLDPFPLLIRRYRFAIQEKHERS